MLYIYHFISEKDKDKNNNNNNKTDGSELGECRRNLGDSGFLVVDGRSAKRSIIIITYSGLKGRELLTLLLGLSRGELTLCVNGTHHSITASAPAELGQLTEAS